MRPRRSLCERERSIRKRVRNKSENLFCFQLCLLSCVQRVNSLLLFTPPLPLLLPPRLLCVLHLTLTFQPPVVIEAQWYKVLTAAAAAEAESAKKHTHTHTHAHSSCCSFVYVFMFVLSHCAIKTNGQTTVQRAQRANHQHWPPDGAFDFLDFATPHAAAAAEGGSGKGKEKQISNPAVCVVVLSHSQRMQREHALSLSHTVCVVCESQKVLLDIFNLRLHILMISCDRLDISM